MEYGTGDITKKLLEVLPLLAVENTFDETDPSDCGDISCPLRSDKAEAQQRLFGEADVIRILAGAWRLNCAPTTPFKLTALLDALLKS